MVDERVQYYGDAIVALARAERALDAVEDELLRVSKAIEGDRDLHDALTNIQHPVERRIQALERILPTAHPATRSAMAMLVAGEQAGRLGEIASHVSALAARERGRDVAEVYVAVPIDDDRREQLRLALERATGKQLSVKVFVDPSVIGGVLAKVGDTVIDGTIAARLAHVRSRLGG